MAEESRNESPTPDDDNKNKKRQQKQQKIGGGVISRFWKGILGRSNKEEDYEKKLQYLSKEEATVHARLKRRARSWRIRSRNIIVFSVLLEVIAVAYAIMTTRSVNLDWKMRAARVFPIFGLPILSTLIYSTLVSFTRMLDRRDQKTLERLRAERQAKIDELKERTNYYLTQQLIQRYDLDPAAKAAAATILASKLGADSGLKVYVGDESNNTKPPLGRPPLGRRSDFEMMNTSGLRNRKPAHIRSNSTGNPALTQYIDETNFEYGVDGDESPHDQNQRAVEHFKAPSTNDGGWLARIAALLVGEDPTQCYALICGNCHIHNGLARKEDFPYITYYCPHCQALNSSQQSDNSGSVSSMGKVMPPAAAAAAGVNYISGPTKGNVTSSNLDPVQELPTGDEYEVNEDAS